jgi:hypothetical protein
MKSSIFKVMLFVFLLTQSPFVYSDTGDAVRDLVFGIGKLWKTATGAVAKLSKNEKVRKVASAVSTVGDIAMGAAGQEAAQRNKEAEERRAQMLGIQRPQSQQENNSIEQETEMPNEQGNDTKNFDFNFYNGSSFNVTVIDYRDLRGNSGLGNVFDELFYSKSHTIQPFGSLNIPNKDPDRNILDNSFSFEYNKEKVAWRIADNNFPFREASFFDTGKEDFNEDNYDKNDHNENEDTFVHQTDNSVPDGQNPETQIWEFISEDQPPLVIPAKPEEKTEQSSSYIFSVPLIKGFEIGKYYLQLASFQNAESAQEVLDKIGNNVPAVIMKAYVNVRGEDMYVYRVLIGPVNYYESGIYLQYFQSTYSDAFIWFGR